MGTGARPDRVAEEFREILAEEIPKLKDPRVGFVTVVGVRVTPDLRKAHVSYSVYGEEPDHKATQAALLSATKHLRAVIGRQVRLKFVPSLEFHEETLTGADRIDELLHKGRNDAAE